MTSNAKLRNDIADANRQLIAESCRTPEDEIRQDARSREIWEPLANTLLAIACPDNREAEAMAYGHDYVGALPDGALVLWGDISNDSQVYDWHTHTVRIKTITGFFISERHG